MKTKTVNVKEEFHHDLGILARVKRSSIKTEVDNALEAYLKREKRRHYEALAEEARS